jgi:site-specific recombinase XerD
MREQILQEYRDYLQLKGYRPGSVQSMAAQAKRYEEHRGQGLDYYQKLRQRVEEKTLSKNTFNHYVFCLKSYFQFLEESGRKAPAYKLLKEKKHLPETEILTVEEVKILFAATIKKPPLAARDKAVLACLYHLGLRAGEAANLKPADLDFIENLAFVAKSKTGRQRQVPMSRNAQDILITYLQGRISKGDCFLQGLKGNLTANGLEQIVKRIAKQAGLKKRIYPHLLRHSIASHLLKSGMPLKQVGKFLGHQSLESTQRYTHLIHEL